MLRIYGNRALKTLPGDVTRPTAARVRESLFNIWQGTIDGCRWLDLCAGSGAMGAEALCRGAADVVGIEQLAPACKIIRQNWQKVAKPDQRYTLYKGDVVRQLSRLRQQTFDYIYFDPPYTSELYIPVLERIAQLGLLTEEGELAVEHSPDCWAPVTVEGLELVRQKHYGKAHLAFYCLTKPHVST
jgi:16S rRNA (guanine966-N2)-methyltransferase